MAKRVALYLRVPTSEQTTDNQRLELERVAERRGWEIAGVYEDAGINGANGRNKRPALDRLLEDANRRRFDVVMAWSVDRLGRSLPDLVDLLGQLHALGIDLYLDKQGVDTTTPAGKAMFQMMGVFAEFERSIIQERIKAGLEKAKTQGTKTGRPIGRPRLPEESRQAILEDREAGLSLRKVALKHGVALSTVQGVLKEHAEGLAV